jgi:Flp pilus assembly protein TadD
MTLRYTGSARLAALLRTVALDPMSLAVQKSAIREALDRSQGAIARELLDEALRVRPLDAELLSMCGLASLQQRRYSEASQSLAIAIALGSQPAEIHYSLAFARFCDRRYADALDVLTPQICLVVPRARVLRARCLHQLGELEQAISECMARVALAPEDTEAQGFLALLSDGRDSRRERARSSVI